MPTDRHVSTASPLSNLTKNLKRAAAAVPVVALMTLTVSPVVHAATYTYANKLSTKENQYRNSGVRSSISGGKASTSIFSEGAGAADVIETYYSYPGYYVVGSAEGTGSVTLSHARSDDAQQHCQWYWPYGNDIGSLKITCSSYS